MEKVWVQDDLSVANVDVAEQLLNKGKEINIFDYIEENMTASDAKKLRLTLIGYSMEAKAQPAIFEACVDPNEPILKQLSAVVDQTSMSAEMGTSQVLYKGRQLSDADTCLGLKIQADSTLLLMKLEGKSGRQGKRWFRTMLDRITTDSSWYMSTTNRDALKF